MAGESILLTTVNWLPTSELISSMSKMDYQGQNVGHYFSLFVSYTCKWISNPQPYPPPYSYKQEVPFELKLIGMLGSHGTA